MSAISPADLRTLVIRPALDGIGWGGGAAEVQILGTILQESGGGRYLHQMGGPAIGIGQTEPATYDDINSNYLAFRPDLKAKVDAFRIPYFARSVLELEGNLYLAAIYVRLKYLRAPQPLAAEADLDGQAALWKAIYNTAGGAGSEAEYKANWLAAFPR